MTPEQQRALALARARRRRQEDGGHQQPQSGTILPITRDADGVRFDSDAGLLGMAKRAFTLPGDVMAGRVDPMSDEGIGRAGEMAAFGTPINPAVRSGSGIVPGVNQAMKRERPKPPSAETLRETSGRQYDELRDLGVDYSSDAVGNLARTIQRELEADGILREVAPKTHRVLRQLTNPPDDSVVSISGLEAARRTFNNAGRDFNNPTDQMAAKRVRDRIDQFIVDPPEAGVVAGPASAASTLAKSARGNYAAAKRSDRLTGIGEAAELRAAVANSGQNLDNSTRQRLASLLLNQRQRAGFSPDELGAVEGVARGSRGANTLRATGNILGGGGGLGAMLSGALGGGTGALIGGAPGAMIGTVAVPGIGAVAKRGAARMTQRGLREVDDMTRTRSPLYERMLADAPMVPARDAGTEALFRALVAQIMGGAVEQ